MGVVRGMGGVRMGVRFRFNLMGVSGFSYAIAFLPAPICIFCNFTVLQIRCCLITWPDN